MTKEELMCKFLGKKVHVIIRDEYHPIDVDGYVTLVDDACHIHGTWGGLSVVLPEDSIELLPTAEEIVYSRMCNGCLREKQCHNDAYYCDKFLTELEKDNNKL